MLNECKERVKKERRGKRKDGDERNRNRRKVEEQRELKERLINMRVNGKKED